MVHYGAFISYSHADTPCARWLHRALETYRVPKKLIGTQTPVGIVPRRLPPVFRDRDELPASGDLGTELRAALAGSAFQIVLCSPKAAASHWVNEEILAFKRVHGDGKVLALIVEGEPGEPERECFPPALRFHMGIGGVLTTEPAEPIAADIRPGGDGKRLASLKIIAGLTGLPLDALVRRDSARRQRRLAWIASGAMAIAVLTLGLAVYATLQRQAAQRARAAAEAQRRTAEASLDFLIGTFQIANPATENPRTITAITLIHRVSDRVKVELRGQPAVSARLLRATGDIYLNLGLMHEAERDLTAALAREPGFGEARATTLVRLARVVRREGDLRRAKLLLADAARAYNPATPSQAPVTALLLEEQAHLAQLGGDSRGAIQAFERAGGIYTALSGDHRLDLARVLKDEGSALIDAKNDPRAEQVLSRAQTIYIAVYGPGHIRTANVMQDRAVVALDAGRLADAERLIAGAVAIYARILEPNHPENANVAVVQGQIAHAEHKLRAAEDAFQRSELIYKQLFGLTNYQTGDADFYLARVLSDERRYPEALETLDHTKQAYDATYGHDDPEQVELLDDRAKIERAAGQKVKAERDCDAALAMRLRLNAHDPDLPAARARCASLLAEPPRIPLTFY